MTKSRDSTTLVGATVDAMSELTIHLNDEDRLLLGCLSMTQRKPVDQLIADLMRLEYDRVYPGQRRPAPGFDPARPWNVPAWRWAGRR